MPKFEQADQKTLLHGCSTTLEFSLVQHIYIYFWSIDTVFSNLTKNALKFSELEKIVLHKFILVAPIMIFEQKTIITFFLHIISLHTLHFHVSYKEVY